MALPIVEKARERLAGRPLVGLLDDAVIARFELYPAEQKVLAALLLADGDLLEAAKLAGTSQASFSAALDNLAARNLVRVDGGKVDLSPAQGQLRVEADAEAEREEGIPKPRIVLRSIAEELDWLAQSDNNGPRAVGRVYARVFGRRATSFPVLGKIASALGPRRAARFFLEHINDDFAGQEPLMALLPQALWQAEAIRNRGVRPEGAPDERARAEELTAEVRAAWKERMRRWLDDGGEAHALACIDQAEDYGNYNRVQADALRHQVVWDFARYRQEGEPEL